MPARARAVMLAAVLVAALAGEARACVRLPDVRMLEHELRGKWTTTFANGEKAVASLYRAHARFRRWELDGHIVVGANPVWSAVVRAVYGWYGWREPPDFESVVADAITEWNEGARRYTVRE